MKVNIKDIGGDIVKNDETYLLKDNKFLKNLVLSSTDLKPNMSTRGHKHEGQEEVYLFIKGSGTMEIDDNKFFVDEGDVVLIKDGAFHRVHAEENGCYFVCVFDGQRYDHAAVLGYD